MLNLSLSYSQPRFLFDECAFRLRPVAPSHTAILQLLLGEVPERAVFNQKGFSVALRPYLALTQAVRQGDLIEFNRVVKMVSSGGG